MMPFGTQLHSKFQHFIYFWPKAGARNFYFENLKLKPNNYFIVEEVFVTLLTVYVLYLLYIVVTLYAGQYL